MSAVDPDLVELGCCVYALDLNTQTDADANQVQGGIVFAIESHVDPDTGEVERRFITATPWRGQVRFDVVLADEVKQIELPNSAMIRSLIRQAGKVVAQSKRAMGTDVARCVSLQQTLMGILG
jgi:hypothetical protein